MLPRCFMLACPLPVVSCCIICSGIFAWVFMPAALLPYVLAAPLRKPPPLCHTAKCSIYASSKIFCHGISIYIKGKPISLHLRQTAKSASPILQRQKKSCWHRRWGIIAPAAARKPNTAECRKALTLAAFAKYPHEPGSLAHCARE